MMLGVRSLSKSKLFEPLDSMPLEKHVLQQHLKDKLTLDTNTQVIATSITLITLN